MSAPADEILLAAWRDGDDASGRVLVDRHFTALYRFFANKLGGDIDDLVQQTFLAVVEGRTNIEHGFRAYLFGVARIRLARYFRDRGARAPADQSVADLVAAHVSVADMLARRDEERLLLRALRRLPLDLQIAVELAYWENLTDREVAAILEIPVGTFKSRLRKARGLLADAMAELADSASLLATTTAGLDGWAGSIRDAFAAIDRRSA